MFGRIRDRLAGREPEPEGDKGRENYLHSIAESRDTYEAEARDPSADKDTISEAWGSHKRRVAEMTAAERKSGKDRGAHDQSRAEHDKQRDEVRIRDSLEREEEVAERAEEAPVKRRGFGPDPRGKEADQLKRRGKEPPRSRQQRERRDRDNEPDNEPDPF